MWTRQDKLEAILERLVGVGGNRSSDPLLIEHMADCVRDRQKTDEQLAEIKEELKEQNRDNNLKHRENSDRLSKLNMMLIAALIGLVATLIAQIVTLTKDHQVPPTLIEQGNHVRP